jgi:uncharacterized protein YdaU (DUF1376 family)
MRMPTAEHGDQMAKKKKTQKGKPPSFQFYVKDWTASPTRQMMSLLAQGAYINLLAVAWDSDPIATIPNRPDDLWRLAGASPAEWEQIRNDVLQPKNWTALEDDPTRLVNKRLRQQWKEWKEFSDEQSDRANKRWEKHQDEGGDREEDESPEEPEEEDEGVEIDPDL